MFNCRPRLLLDPNQTHAPTSCTRACVCVCVCKSTCTRLHVCVCVCVCRHTSSHLNVIWCVFVLSPVSTRHGASVCVCRHTSRPACMATCVYSHVSLHSSRCECVCARACVCVASHVLPLARPPECMHGDDVVSTRVVFHHLEPRLEQGHDHKCSSTRTRA